MERDPADWQEGKEPTRWVETTISRQGGGRTRKAYRQREVDYRLLTGLKEDELRAFDEIGRAVQMSALTRSIRAQVYERVDISTPPDQESRYHNILLLTFKDWAQLVLASEKMDYRAIIAIISEGCGPSKVDKDRRKGKGWARRNLGEGLGLWCELRGWV